MSLDGLSLGNLGINTDMTAAQMATHIEQVTQKESEIKIKDVDGLAEENAVRRKKQDEESKKDFEDGFFEKNDENSEDESEDSEKSSIFNEKFFENSDPKEFMIRINPYTQMVELFSNKEERVLETISPNDLMALISKLDSASGILVNRKI